MRKSLIIGAHAYISKGNAYSGFLMKAIKSHLLVMASRLANAIKAHFLGASSVTNYFATSEIIIGGQKNRGNLLILDEDLDQENILNSLKILPSHKAKATIVVISPIPLENTAQWLNKEMGWLVINPPAFEVMGSMIKTLSDSISGPVVFVINHISMMPRLADQKSSDIDDKLGFFINIKSLRDILEVMLTLHKKTGAAFVLIDNPKTLGPKNCALMQRLFQSFKG